MSESPLSVVNSVKNQLKGLKNNAGLIKMNFNLVLMQGLFLSFVKII